MRNERRAGRKPRLSEEDLIEVRRRREAGESISRIAESYGISRQALSKTLQNQSADSSLILDYLLDGEVMTRIFMDLHRQEVRLENYCQQISQRAFGYITNPTWAEVGQWLESLYHRSENSDHRMEPLPLCMECGRKDFTLNEVVKQLADSNQAISLLPADAQLAMTRQVRFAFTRRDLLYARTDTDGFQFKALSSDRKYFVKAQAIISGTVMNDWAVEVIASDICQQLGIPCVRQMPCQFIYEGHTYQGVYSANFELDGFSFISFETLLERIGGSTREEEFIRLSAIDKLHWCAGKLAQAGGLEEDATLRYMLDLAVVDCLVANVDRHTRNFGLFFNCMTGSYEIPLLFDNGMGLFEHDYYRDQNRNYEEAMRSVYVSPYGEDPFDLMKMLDMEFDLRRIYPGLSNLHYQRMDCLTNFAEEYMERMEMIWQK